jgi:hypothetical protein
MTVVLFAAAVVLVAAGVLLLVLDGRRRAPVLGPGPRPPLEPGSLFRDPYEGRGR